MRIPPRTLPWAALLLAAVGASRGAAAGELAATAGPDIQLADLRAHLQVLASDEFEGRETLAAGGRRAAEYVAASFARSELTPLGADGGWFQPYVVEEPVLGKGNRLLATNGAADVALEVTKDWNPVSVSPSATVRGAAVFAGFGIAAHAQGHDDYAGADVEGKIVLLLRKAPKKGLERHAALIAKVAAAARHGAAAVLLCNDEPTAKDGGDALLSWGADVGGRVGSSPVPFGFTSRDAMSRLLRLAGLELAALERRAREAPGVTALAGVTLSLTTAVATTRESNARNVVGFLPGRDPELAQQVVVVGAHHDHVGLGGNAQSLAGAGGTGQVHNGADDNGSGTVALLELAEWFAVPANRPRRSLLFLSFSGEERGLLGSQHYVDHPIVPLADTVAMVNLDMIGRCTKGRLEVGGVGTGRGLQELVAAANQPHGLELSWDPQGTAPSDSTSFFRKKIPVLFLFTGLHPDYHRPGDDVEKICFDDLLRISLLTRDVVRELAERDERVVYTDPPKQRRRAILGVQPSPEPDEHGILLAGVGEDGPAAEAGIQAGDVLVKVAGQTVRKLQDLQQVLPGWSRASRWMSWSGARASRPR
jgi:Zn-dependent M28 family amino/carboxypeptidase